jgi:hypothetical protein
MKKQQKKYQIIFIFFGLSLSIIVYLIEIKKRNMNEKKVNHDLMVSCQSNRDCISVSANCCGCNAGGGNRSINKKYKEEWLNDLKDKCQDQYCPQVISDHWTCFAKSICKENMCVLIAEKVK